MFNRDDRLYECRPYSAFVTPEQRWPFTLAV
jgi:hypothetical protein